ncbi:hypothetical protein BU019_10785 [Staphylococcus simulans]|nr:hypothetical protein BU053_11495 [Staphylococcus simulans]PTJ01369.1 hypothetical protein BU047_10835 [Staphylococcus simulans]PTJ16660.1 hypothetical protein BU037_08055 [Staphylococcus simulans]PTJ23940.1 hypothetical protein BU039_03245 [Staphylococcus simulans]PTJ50385.1 hypothetical protein BU019_10785 [Staphylococcus simulans]
MQPINNQLLLQYPQRPQSTLKRDENNRVIYLGAFPQTLPPSLRISYMILPKLLENNRICKHPQKSRQMIKIEKFMFQYKQNKKAINPEKMIASSFY